MRGWNFKPLCEPLVLPTCTVRLISVIFHIYIQSRMLKINMCVCVRAGETEERTDKNVIQATPSRMKRKEAGETAQQIDPIGVGDIEKYRV